MWSYAGNFVAGKFCFRFWDFGKWRKISVDDRLPTKKNANGINELIFGQNKSQPHEYWIPLCEKAFVKYMLNSFNSYRCYAITVGGLVV